MEAITNLGTDGLIAGGLLLFAVFGFIKRLVKLFFFVISLAVASVAGIWGYNNGYTFSKVIVDQPEDWMVIAVGFVAFVGAFFFMRALLSLFSGGNSEHPSSSKFAFGIPGSLLSLLVGAVISYAALTGVRYAGTVAELERVKAYSQGTLDLSKEAPLFVKLKTWIDESKVGQWHQKIDFVNDPVQAALAKLAILKEEKGNSKLATHKVAKAIPVEKTIQRSIREGDFSAILNNEKLRAVAADAQARAALLQLNIEKVLGLKK